MVIAARMEHEHGVETVLGQLYFNDELWETVPDTSRNFDYRNTSFKMLSRSGCAIAYYQKRIHAGCPYEVFFYVLRTRQGR